MTTSPTRICAPGYNRVGPSTALPETVVPNRDPASSITRPVGTEAHARVRARDRLVGDPDVRVLAAPDRQRPADRHARAVGQQQDEPLGFGGRGHCRHVSHSSDNGCQTGLSAFVAIAFGIPARLWMLTTPMSPIGFDVHDAWATSTASA